MGRSHRLRLDDVRTVFRLLGEVRELGANPLVWRRHMLESLGRTVGIQVGVSGEVVYEGGVPAAGPESLVDVGWACAEDRADFMRFLASPEATHCPVFCTIGRWRPGGHTRNYSDGWIDPPFDARTWHRSALQERRRAAGLEGRVYSQHALPAARAVHVIVLNRGPGEEPFTARQTRLLHLFHEELARLWHPPARDELAELPPRLRQTLDGLLAGLSEKQEARQLGVSQHTVHNYVKELHRRLGVASRGELLARCAVRPRYDFVPRLSICLPCRRSRKEWGGKEEEE
jgi:DNA-binding CsgD family transcriptional regulator